MEGKRRMCALSDVVRSFDEQGDIVAWLTKEKQVTELQHKTEVVKLILLYLEGQWLALYLEMNERDWMDHRVIESMLIKAFTNGPLIAYCQLIKAKWTSKSVDAYDNIRWLAEFVGKNAGKIAKLAFVH